MSVLSFVLLVYTLGTITTLLLLSFVAGSEDGEITGPFPREHTGLVIVVLALLWPIVLATSEFRLKK